MSDEIKDMKNKFSKIGLSWMEQFEAKLDLDMVTSILEEPQIILNELKIAQWHYMDLIGITSSGLFDKDILSKEQKEYAHLIKKQDGKPVFEDDQCVIFMSEKHNLPIELCAMYVCSRLW